MNMKLIAASVALSAWTLSASVGAVEIDVSESNGESSLQSILDGVTVGGVSSIDVNNDQASPSDVWKNTDSGVSPIRYVASIAGNTHPNSALTSFGIYDPNAHLDLSKRYTIFDSAIHSVGYGDEFAVADSGKVYSGSNVSDFTGVQLSGSSFGFYLQIAADGQNPGYTLFSQNSRNPNGDQQMVAFNGDGTDEINISHLGNTVWTSGGWMLAWEDAVLANSDEDFNDFVVLIESAMPVPEPGTIALLGLGLAGLGAARRRQRA